MNGLLRWTTVTALVSGIAGCSGDDGADSNGSSDTPDTTVRQYGYDDANIVYSGRVHFQDDGDPPHFSSPAVSVSARFKGTAVAMRVHDFAMTSNYLDVVIDGDYANATKVQSDSSDDLTEIASGLPYGEHTISIVKRTEANTGQLSFSGFDISGEILPPPERPSRKLIIIGDSISAGSGNEAADRSPQCMQDYGRPFSNAGKAWGPVLARSLDAEYHVTAVSGIGVIRNYNCSENTPMPAVYDRVYLEAENSPEWDHSKFDPDAIVIMIGTNDFSPDGCDNPPLNETYDAENYRLFLSELEAFVVKLRGLHANAEIFLTSSPMLNDGWPDETYTSDSDQRAAIATVADNLETSGEGGGKVHVILADYDSSRYAGRGCGTHPNLFDHSIVAGFDPTRPDDPSSAALLLNPIRSVLGW
jgi:lysophospholipase L1-like esterase